MKGEHTIDVKLYGTCLWYDSASSQIVIRICNGVISYAKFMGRAVEGHNHFALEFCFATRGTFESGFRPGD